MFKVLLKLTWDNNCHETFIFSLILAVKDETYPELSYQLAGSLRPLPSLPNPPIFSLPPYSLLSYTPFDACTQANSLASTPKLGSHLEHFKPLL